jgi:hypothetical protein
VHSFAFMSSDSLQTYMAGRPTLEQFTEIARREFAFLVSEFGLCEEPVPDSKLENRFQVRFVGPACRVSVEGRSFGVAVGVKFQRLGGGHANLSEILPVECQAEAEPLRHPGDQRELLRIAALLVRRHAGAAIRAEPEVYQAAEAIRAETLRKSGQRL